jgi:hypothetical protein
MILTYKSLALIFQTLKPFFYLSHGLSSFGLPLCRSLITAFGQIYRILANLDPLHRAAHLSSFYSLSQCISLHKYSKLVYLRADRSVFGTSILTLLKPTGVFWVPWDGLDAMSWRMSFLAFFTADFQLAIVFSATGSALISDLSTWAVAISSTTCDESQWILNIPDA